MPKSSKHAVDQNAAETIGLSALRFLADDGPRLGHFLALTGIGPDELRTGAGSPAVLAAVLDHLMRDEALLLAFAANAGLRPEMVADAANLLFQHGQQR